MKWRVFMVILVFAGMFLTAGCKSLFPHSESTTVSHWKTYKDVEIAFGKITPYHTTVEDLQLLHFDPKLSPNVKILTYVDIIQTFLPNAAIHKEDLPGAVRACIEAKEKSRAYLVELHVTKDKRHGCLFLDIFGFKRQTHTSGWEFKGLILIKDDLVVYKLSSGDPRISRDENKVKPLGPLQEIDSIITGPASYAR
ncbi:MAG: hypothetical protein PHY43_01130 [Verrucomicrobiales bacterium]|nr:hypothetical protein [Verrucomicrobiales bacterium]